MQGQACLLHYYPRALILGPLLSRVIFVYDKLHIIAQGVRDISKLWGHTYLPITSILGPLYFGNAPDRGALSYYTNQPTSMRNRVNSRLHS
jgi:hypothetical protein